MMRNLTALPVMVLFAGIANAQILDIVSPRNDGIVLKNPLMVDGVAENGIVSVIVKNSQGNVVGTAKKKVTQNKFTAVFNNLNVDTYVINVAQGKSQKQILVSVGKGIKKSPTQKVWFDWRPGVNEQLRKIAEKTLNLSNNPKVKLAQLTAFEQGVRQRSMAIFAMAFVGIDVQVVEKPGQGVHTIAMLANSGSIFGQSPFDFGSVVPGQNSEVWVGTYRAAIVDDFSDLVFGWQPMKKNDDLVTRIEDVAHALGRTSAHELGHSLGLVGSTGNSRWMRGCDGGHNCDVFDSDFSPLGDRFASGRYIMDPGGKTANSARIAEPSRNGRAANRQPAVFNQFNQSYFDIVHP